MTPQDKKRLEEIRGRGDVSPADSEYERLCFYNYTEDVSFLLRLLDEEREKSQILSRDTKPGMYKVISYEGKDFMHGGFGDEIHEILEIQNRYAVHGSCRQCVVHLEFDDEENDSNPRSAQFINYGAQIIPIWK